MRSDFRARSSGLVRCAYAEGYEFRRAVFEGKHRSKKLRVRWWKVVKAFY